MTTTIIPLGELVNIQTGKLDANASSATGAYPFFTCAREPLQIAEWKYDLDAILIAGNGDLNVKHYKGKFDAYQRTYILDVRDTDVLDSRFLFHFMDKYVERLREQSIGGIIKYIKLGMLTDAQIPLPPLKEQKRIAGILDQADALRRLRTRALEKLNTLGQAIFHEMFECNETPFPPATLGEVCDVRDGTHDSPTYVEDGYPLMTSKNFSSGTLSFEGARMISEDDYEKINRRSKVDLGDIVMPMIGTIGSPVIIREEPRFAIKNLALIKFSPSSPRASFIHALLSGPYLEHIVKTQGRGGTQKFVSLGDLRKLSFPLPPVKLQEKFELRTKAIKSQELSLASLVIKANDLFASLQHRAFRGEL